MDCLRCGNCCRADMSAYVTDRDIELWRSMGRFDLIEDYEADTNLWAGDKIVSSAGDSLTACRFLLYTHNGYSCSIYEARPAVCREFIPGESRFCSINNFNTD